MPDRATVDTRSESLAVIIPCFNAGRYLDEAVASVVGERLSYASVSVVVVDDHSDDAGTLKILAHFEAQASPIIRVIRNSGRRGVSAARNLGVKESSGRWLAFLDADDAMTPGGLGRRLQVASEYPEASWIGGDFVLCSATGEIDSEPFLRSHKGPRNHLRPAFESGAVQILHRPAAQFLDTLLTHTDCSLLRRELFERVGGFYEQLQTAEDYHLWVRLAAVADFYFVPEVVAKYRRHEQSLTYDRPRGEMRMDALRLLREDPRLGSMLRGPIEAKMLKSYLEDVHHYRRIGQFPAALRAALGALRLRPTSGNAWRSAIAAAAHRR